MEETSVEDKRKGEKGKIRRDLRLELGPLTGYKEGRTSACNSSFRKISFYLIGNPERKPIM